MSTSNSKAKRLDGTGRFKLFNPGGVTGTVLLVSLFSLFLLVLYSQPLSAQPYSKELADPITDLIELTENPFSECGQCQSGIIEIMQPEATLCGPLGCRTPHISPGIPFTLENFLECPLGIEVYHPGLPVVIATTCDGCGTVITEETLIHYGEGEDGQIVLLPPDKRIRDRQPLLPPGPRVEFNPVRPFPGPPTGDYRSIPRAPGQHNCGTALLCYLVQLLGYEDAMRWKELAEQGLRELRGPCARYAWEVVDPNVLRAILRACEVVEQ